MRLTGQQRFSFLPCCNSYSKEKKKKKVQQIGCLQKYLSTILSRLNEDDADHNVTG